MASEVVSLTHAEFLKTFGLRIDAILPQWIAAPIGPRGPGPASWRLAWTARLARDGWKQATASSAPLENIGSVLTIIGLGPVSQAIVSAEDVTLGKPDPPEWKPHAAPAGYPLAFLVFLAFRLPIYN
jgi:hypothetical protein